MSRNYPNQAFKISIISNETNQQCVFLVMHQEEHINFMIYSCQIMHKSRGNTRKVQIEALVHIAIGQSS